MSNKVSNIFGLVFMAIVAGIIVFAIIFSYIFPEIPTSIQDNSAEYQITNYNVEMTVNQNNTITVSEALTVHFSVQSKGIFRALPTINEIKTIDGNGSIINSKKFRVNYSNIAVDEIYDTYTENDFLFIQIGNPYVYAPETESYTITYTVELDSRYASYNQFYYNILGNLWDTTIGTFNAIINFASAVNATTDLTEIYVGQYGSTTQITPDWNIEKTILMVNQTNIGVGEGITVLVNLQDGYFTAPFDHLPDIVMLSAIILFAIIICVVYIKNNNDKMVVPVVQFNVNKKFTSADVGYIIDKTVDNKDIASLIILWAQKGYLEIIEEKKKTFLRKIKDADNKMKQYEKTMFETIFDKEDKKINLTKIGEKIVTIIQPTKSSIKFENEKAFNKKAEIARNFIILFMGIIFGVVLAAINYQNVNMFFTYLSVFVAVVISLSLFVWAKKRDMKDILDSKNLFFSKIGIFVLLCGIFAYVFFSFDSYCDIFFTSFAVFAELLLTIFIISKFNIRTDEGIDDLGDIVGLKNFIEVTEKDRLELLAKENPTMFFDVMPFAYVLGVYEKWCKKFENIVLETPTWYVGNNTTFNYLIMLNLMYHTTNSFLQAVNTAQFAKMASTVSSGTSFGGGSGGGFSGGGFGGGGGGRW